ncbi:MAG TPA: molybdopterin cofactor-binding domain-containing protein [Gemmatimonadaceae bacterium]|nr:molybdopterin cofactor-binding domain-containing protein [Gemmatimonadaceae bacterium]
MTHTRRDFLRMSGMAAGLAVAVPVRELLGAQTPAALEPEAYLHVGTDGLVTIWVIRLEMGQGVRTLLPMMIAEELEADWTKIRVEQAAPGGKFQKIRLHTSGSGSSSETFMRLRSTGAAAREMLVAAAATEWNVDASSCRAQSGAVIHVATGRRRPYGTLAAAAALLPVPATPTLKDASEFRLLGKPMRRIDGPDIAPARRGTASMCAYLAWCSHPSSEPRRSAAPWFASTRPRQRKSPASDTSYRPPRGCTPESR